jgi:DNA end-binding protein Ku
MATSVWKGHLSFGLVSIPVKLYRAARAEKVGFRQVHEETGTRVRQALFRELGEPLSGPVPVAPGQRHEPPQARSNLNLRVGSSVVGFAAQPPEVEVCREELAKGYEYEPGRYLVLNRAEIESITPRTAQEMQILEFVKLAEVDPIYFETSYYVAPDRAGERAYCLLFEALRASGFVGIAQVAMHRREHVVVIRPGRTGIVLHTMFYETEIRREDEYRVSSQVAEKELEMALLLVNNLVVAFDASKYRDGYRDKLDELIQAKLQARTMSAAEQRRPAPVVNILDALRRSLESDRGTPASQTPAPPNNKTKRSRTKQRSANDNQRGAGLQA